MKIVALVNVNGEVCEFFDDGQLVLFDKGSGEWRQVKTAPLSLRRDMGMAEIKFTLQNAVRFLLPCEVFLTGKLRGVLHVFLEDCGFRVWESQGPLLTQLENVALKETSLKEADLKAQTELPRPHLVGDAKHAHFRIDLAALLAAGDCHASHDLLMPFLETTSFSRLEVFCDHLPKWFDREFSDLGLKIEMVTPDSSGCGMTVLIVPKLGLRSTPPGKRPGRSSCRCG
jgi:Fe-only nitrogenase accessory protein AnfO